MADFESKVEEYQRLRLGYLPVLSLHIGQTPHELGDPVMHLGIELLKPDLTHKVLIEFSNVSDLKIGRLRPGSICLLQIRYAAADQMEQLRYEVFNGEQDLTLSFNCWDFKHSELPL